MPFSERIKRLAKSKAAFRCCVCHKPFVEIHHLIPQSEGGSDDLENAAPLCASCHDLYGGDPEKRKILTQMRDHWWDLMEARNFKLTDLARCEQDFEVPEDPHYGGSLHEAGVAIYHVIFADENFETAASALFRLVAAAQNSHPNKRRFLYLDIEGHRNEKGGFDDDMFELQRHFLLGLLGLYLAELHCPLMHLRNPKLQHNDLPAELNFLRENFDRKDIIDAIDKGAERIWLAEKNGWLDLPKSKTPASKSDVRRRYQRRNGREKGT